MTLGPPPVSLYTCPKCGFPSCSAATGGLIICTNCFATWPNKAAFDAVRSSSIDFGTMMEDLDEEIKQSEYIESGQMKEDIEQLVARAVADKMLNFTDRLAYDVRQILDQNVNPEERMRNIRELVNRHRDEAQMDWAEVADGDED